MRSAAIALVFLAGASVPAQIVLKPAAGQSAPLRPKTLDLDVTIRRAVAETKFEYVFANEGQWRGEADFLIAIPENGVVTGFAYWYEGEKVVARVTEKERARDIYRAITTRRRDPALIEMVGKRTFRVKVFPVEANADLRVELKMVQTLPSTANGAQLVVPTKRLGRLERIDVDVRGEGPLAVAGFGKTVPNFQYRAENVTVPDLKITAVRPKRPYVADLRAARSGGTGGFFALTLTAARGMARPRLSFSGVAVRDVMGLPARMAPGKAYTVVGRYENVRPGARMYLAGAGGARFSEALDFSAVPEPNGPAAKLWAWAKIGRSANRKEIVALSVRHTVPSRFTSWIAIPTEERKRFDYEIRMGDLRRFGRRVEGAIKRHGVRSPQARRELVAFYAKAKALGLPPNQVGLDVHDEAQRTAERWEREVSRRGENSPTAVRLGQDLETFARLGATTDAVRGYYQGRVTELASQVYGDRYEGREGTAAAKARRGRFERAARLAGYSDGGRWLLENVASGTISDEAERIARAERSGESVPDADRRTLERREYASGVPAGTALKNQRFQLAYDEANRLTRLMADELGRSEPDLARVTALQAERAREAPVVEARGYEMPSALNATRGRTHEVLDRFGDGKSTAEEVAVWRATLDRYAEAAGESGGKVYGEVLTEMAQQADLTVQYGEKKARRDRGELVVSNERAARFQTLDPAAPKWRYQATRGEPDQEIRDAYVAARHEGKDADELLERVRSGSAWRGADYPKTRAELLRTLTELDAMDVRTLTPEEARTKAELERKAQELHARMGDPIVTFVAPADAIGMHAVLPDGTRLPMTWVARHARWEARFDIPAGTPDGPFAVRVDGAHADGRPIAGRAEFRVDSKAPSVRIERDGSLLVLRTDEDVVRAVAIVPDGSRREMVRHDAGRFALKDVPAGDVRVIATDRAHNRSDMATAPILPAGEAIDSAMNVQALARFGDRLWISTLDAGGRFEGEAAVPEVGPWPRQAVATGRTLAVRAATGEVHLFDGAWSIAERDATTLAVDGDRLLVGIVGGWIERGATGDRRVVRLPDLAGRVVTCLFADGARLWIGTQGRGLYEYDRATGAGRWHDERHGLTDDWITAIGRDGSGRIVAGTFVGGALARDGEGWRVLPGTEGTCVTAICGDLVATRSGLFLGGRIVEAGEAQAIEDDPGIASRVGWRGRIGAAPPR